MVLSPLVGIGAGIASGILALTIVTGQSLGAITLLLFPMPIAIAGLGWSRLTALLAVVVSAIILGLAAPPLLALAYALAVGVPFVVFCYFATLNRDIQLSDGQQSAEWYPIGRVVGAVALWAGGLSALILASVEAFEQGALRKAARQLVDRLFDEVFKLPPDLAVQMTDARRNEVAGMVEQYFPFALASTWMLVGVVALYFAAVAVFRSDRLGRAWPDLSALLIPRELNLVFIAAAVGSFIEGPIGITAKCFIWSIATAYVLQGLAILHQTLRGSAFRGLALFGAYLALFFVPLYSNMVLALIGIAEPVSPIRRSSIETITEANPLPPNTPGGPGGSGGGGPVGPGGRGPPPSGPSSGNT